jgi:hypothetical protein
MCTRIYEVYYKLVISSTIKHGFQTEAAQESQPSPTGRNLLIKMVWRFVSVFQLNFLVEK